MFKKILVLAALIPGLAGCFVSDDDGRHHGRHEVHRDHSHGSGCGHVFRGGIWIVAN